MEEINELDTLVPQFVMGLPDVVDDVKDLLAKHGMGYVEFLFQNPTALRTQISQDRDNPTTYTFHPLSRCTCGDKVALVDPLDPNRAPAYVGSVQLAAMLAQCDPSKNFVVNIRVYLERTPGKEYAKCFLLGC